MRKTKNLSRVMSMILAFCLSVALLPAQAFAATTDDDPATWPAPDSHYTAPDKNPVYLMVDFTDEDNGGVAAAHRCLSGAELNPDIVKATASAGGRVKYTCDTCGSWAQINVPALTLSAFTLDPAYLSATTTGVEYSGNAYTVVYNVAPAFHRYVGTTLDNHVSVTAPGSYGIIITVDSAIYDNVELRTAERLLVYPKAVPWTAEFDSKIYDGNSLLDGKTVTYLDVNGVSVPAALSACQVKVEGGELTVDTAAPVTRPVAAGPYAIGATITDDNYVWQTEDGKYNTVYTLAWIFPATNTIYVGDTVQAVRLTTGSSVYASPYTWTIDPSYAGFNSSKPGTTEVQAVITKGGASFGRATIPVTVIPRPILSIEEVVRTAPMGTAFNKLGLPSTVSVVAEGGTGNAQTVTGVPVTWSSTGYDPYALTQTVRGTLNLSRFPQLSGDNIPAVTATVNLTYGTVEAPSISDYTKTYDGQSTALPMPGLPEGIQSVTVAYKGTANNGRPYSSSNPPVNAGSYTATVSFVMEQGYPQLSATAVSYTIEKAAQTCPAPTLAASDTNSLTLNAVENAEYSMDGQVWQDSPVFKNLDAGTAYTLYQRLKSTEDGNYNASPAASAQFSTEFTTVNPGDLSAVFKPQSYPYTGNPIAYQVPAISHVTKSTVTYTVDGQTTTAAPTNAGTYPVTVSFTMQAGTAPLDPVTSTLTITKVEQNAPAAPRASNTATNSITITAIPGAVFSIDGGKTWQASTIFEGLTPDTAYTILAKYPGDRNHEESPTSSAIIRTTRQNASAGTVQSAVYTYDGTPKSLVADVPAGCTQVVQTFTGTNGTAYGPTTEPPTNPGVYNVKVSYTMQSGYEELQPQYATLTINKATPAKPLAPVVTGVTDSSITIEVVDGMAYSIDGGVTWQTTGTFTGLTRDTTYEVKVKAVETACYKELEGPSTMQATEKTTVTFERFADQTVEYTGHAQTYTLPKSNPGIASMTITGYDGIATPPVTVGDYVVNIDFVAAEGYKLPETLPAPVLHITRASGEAGTVRPVLKDETVTYTGAPQRYHGADGIEGISSVALTYTGADGVESTSAPTNAGVYHVTAIFSPDANHTLAAGNYSATLTIRKAGQDTPMASLESSSSHSLTVSAIPGAEYSIDGGTTWQTGNTFSGLDADKSYTILVRMAEDENHTASGTRPVSGRTTDTPVDILDADMPAYSTVYNGNRQPYPYTSLLTDMDGVKSVSVMYVGTLASGKPYETSEAPVNAGTYKVRFYLVAEDGYDLSAEQVYADMTISKAPQAMTTAPTIARRTTTTIALNPVPGAEYSMDGGETWQDSPKFTGLTPDTAYTFTQRMKETDNLTASDSQSVEGRTVADTGLDYEIDYRKEIITFDPDVVEAGKDYTLTDNLPSGGTITPGTTLYVRLVDDGTGNSGPVVMEVLPERPTAPDVKVNPFDFTMNTTTGMEYSDDGGETWKPCTDNQNVEDRQGETLLVRIAATDDSFKSDPTTVTVPVRGAAPVLTIDNAIERMDSTAAMEYSKDGGGTWIPCLDNMDLSELTNATLLVRYACDGTNPASNTATLTVPSRNAAPTADLDRVAERLTVSGTTPEYRTENGWTAVPADGLDASGFYGKELTVREKYDVDHFASLPVLVKVPQKGAKPDLTIDRDKQTVNTTADMEYSTDGGKTWTKCDPDMDVSNLTGQTILVREAATEDQFASDSTELRIPNRTENPTVTLDTITETVNTTEDMDYSIDSGLTWNPCNKPLDVSNLTGQTIIIRNHGDESSFPSSGVSVQIPTRREAPKVEVDSKAQTVSSDKGVEFSADGGKTWTALAKPLNTADYLGKTVLFRYPATREDFASRTVTVVISKHPGAPVLVFDPDNETLNTTPDMEYSTDGGKTWKPCPNPLDVSDLAGKDVLIRYPGKGDGLPGETVTVKIPDRRKAPNVGHTDETRQGRNDGTFTKTDKTMEYRLLPDGKWTAIAGNTVRGLAPGTYEVRYAATASEMASQVQKVTIAKGGSTGGIGDLTTPGSKLSLLNRKDHIAYIAGRTNTQAAPNADITRAEVAAILYRLLTPEAKAAYGTNINRFKDVPAGAWYGTAVSTLCNMGVITGYQDGTFGPQRNITRAELATILARFCDSSGNNTVLDRFTDISHCWARKYINLAAENGLVYGYTDGTFRPDQNITRAETIVMVNRILGRSASADTVVKGYKTFSDVPTGAWYYWDIVEASNGHSFSMNGSTEQWTALG